MCAPQKTSNTGWLGALLLSGVIGAAKATWWVLEHLTAALIVAVVWTTPRAYRLVRRGTTAAWRWYVTRPVVLDRQREPAAELPAEPTAMTLADLRLKEPANS